MTLRSKGKWESQGLLQEEQGYITRSFLFKSKFIKYGYSLKRILHIHRPQICWILYSMRLSKNLCLVLVKSVFWYLSVKWDLYSSSFSWPKKIAQNILFFKVFNRINKTIYCIRYHNFFFFFFSFFNFTLLSKITDITAV